MMPLSNPVSVPTAIRTGSKVNTFQVEVIHAATAVCAAICIAPPAALMPAADNRRLSMRHNAAMIPKLVTPPAREYGNPPIPENSAALMRILVSITPHAVRSEAVKRSASKTAMFPSPSFIPAMGGTTGIRYSTYPSKTASPASNAATVVFLESVTLFPPSDMAVSSRTVLFYCTPYLCVLQ